MTIFATFLTLLCLGHASMQEAEPSDSASCSNGQQRDSDDIGLLQMKLEAAASEEDQGRKIMLGPVIERFMPASILVQVDHIAKDADALASNKSCPCTWNAKYPCSKGGSCWSYSTKGSCEGAGGQFCGSSTAEPKCPCTWNANYPCSLHGSCYSVTSKSTCEDYYQGKFCGNAPPPAPPPPPPPAPPPSGGGGGGGGGSVPHDMQSVLDRHNSLRQTHHAPALSWDAGLASQAESWAKRCDWKHSSMGNGENLYAGSGTFNGASAVQSWYDELHNPGYNYNNAGFSHGTGHFTQVVWKGSTKLGCYNQVCSDLFQGWGNTNFLVCEYSPPGNYQGQFSANVLRP